ncbi:VacJ family lipoprotein [Roseomonas sp. KE0001]|uniref:MlaA family lipoprotein n=1 Tax=Roseomonas sp. KE0001 TaxID=2479201 RepID=UPI0018DFD6A5|nr:VacJ family lipoprotein [Roseomonas sp. KE0001]MBI0435389.1 VacJ family lipoprotein [Roseomonas sp. KE0001]
MRAGAALLLLGLGACAAGGTGGDPLEATNRRVFAVNEAVDRAAILPLAKGYRAVTPAPVRQAVHNALGNLQEPRVFVNTLLQARLADAGHTAMRFVLNSTLGLVGLFEVAAPLGLPRRQGDFGQTLHSWGIGDGPYLMLPLLGPSNARDAVGQAGDVLTNPLNWLVPLEWTLARGGAEGLDQRERNIEALREVREGSLDPYARLRSLWQQNRAAELGGDGAGEGAMPAVLDDPGLDDPGAAP